MKIIVEQVQVLLFNRITKIDWKIRFEKHFISLKLSVLVKNCCENRRLTHSEQSCPRDLEFCCELLESECPQQLGDVIKQGTPRHGGGLACRQRPKTATMFFRLTAQTRRLRQPRPAAAAAADQNVGESKY